MKRMLLAIAVAFLAVGVGMSHASPAVACPGGTFPADGSQNGVGPFSVTAGTTVTLSASNNSSSPSTEVSLNGATVFGQGSASTTVTAAVAEDVSGFVIGNGGGTVTWTVSYNGAGCGTTYFNPGDGRVTGNPWDRVAAWCNADNLDVWGIQNDSAGVDLYRFPYTDLIAAGAKGITRNVEPNGTVFASLDSNNNFFIAWYGGPSGATGIGGFAKTFTCNVPR